MVLSLAERVLGRAAVLCDILVVVKGFADEHGIGRPVKNML
jgi:hypothetical protein